MKSNLLLLFAFVLSITSFKSYSQFTFSVSPGIGLNKANVGYKINDKIVPFAGIQYVRGEMDYKRTRERFDYDTNSIVKDVTTENFKINVLIPNVGVKYFVKEHNKLNAYLSTRILKPIILGEYQYNEEVDEGLQDEIDNTSFWGAELGFGVEYFFDENFSLGGEMGLSYWYMKHKYSYEVGYDPPLNDERTYKYHFSPTYTRLSLNFYF